MFLCLADSAAMAICTHWQCFHYIPTLISISTVASVTEVMLSFTIHAVPYAFIALFHLTMLRLVHHLKPLVLYALIVSCNIVAVLAPSEYMHLYMTWFHLEVNITTVLSLFGSYFK